MNLPVPLKNALEGCAARYSINDLKKSALSVSEAYRNSKRSGSPLVSKELDVVAYALARMPATFAALSKVFENVKPCQTMLDVGAGTGAATWAAKEMKIANQIICLEKANKMREFGLNLMRSTYADVEWRSFDLTKEIYL